MNSVLAEGGACAPDTETLCLHGGRYEVRADYWTSHGDRAAAQVVPKGTSDSGLFRFFDAENWEMLIKVLDGCAINGRYWVYGASTTDLGYEIRVTDTTTNDANVYRNEPGRPAPAITDGKAFPEACGAGASVAAETTEFDDILALDRFRSGTVVHAGSGFKYLQFWQEGSYLEAQAGFVVEGAVVRRRD